MDLEQKSLSPCVWSSLLFITNAINAFYNGHKVYSILFALLTITSVINHMDTTPIKQMADKACVYMIVLNGAYIFFQKNYEPIIIGAIIALFISTIILYNIGKITCTMCFHPEDAIKHNYHVLMHFLASLGHHLIIFF